MFYGFLVPAHPGSPGQSPESRKTVVVVVSLVVVVVVKACYCKQQLIRILVCAHRYTS